MLNFRRVVTGHNAEGKAIIQSDAPPTRVEKIGPNGPTFYEVWNTRESPAKIDRSSGEFIEPGLVLPPPAHGTRIRTLDDLNLGSTLVVARGLHADHLWNLDQIKPRAMPDQIRATK